MVWRCLPALAVCLPACLPWWFACLPACFGGLPACLPHAGNTAALPRFRPVRPCPPAVHPALLTSSFLPSTSFRLQVRLGEKRALGSALAWFEGRLPLLADLEYYGERRLKRLGLLDDSGKTTWDGFFKVGGAEWGRLPFAEAEDFGMESNCAVESTLLRRGFPDAEPKARAKARAKASWGVLIRVGGRLSAPGHVGVLDPR